MFWPDVVELKNFYSTPVGQISCRLIRRKIKELWGEVKGESILGIGYATPYLMPFVEDSQLAIAFMPAAQGAIHWPVMRDGKTVLTHEDELPLPDNSVERVIIAHALENTDHSKAMLAEVWRVLVPGGKLIVVVPNRSGLWSRIENNPFAYGRPYSRSQLNRLFAEQMFMVNNIESCLYGFPGNARYILRTTDFMERIGPRLFKFMAGALILDAEKQVYSIKPIKGTLARAGKYIYIPATPQTA